MKCKICETNETDSTSGICDECIRSQPMKPKEEYLDKKREDSDKMEGKWRK